MMFQCSVIGEGNTVYEGSAFDCHSSRNEITLLHSRFSSNSATSKVCNNGDIVGKSLRVEDDCYTSQLSVKVSSNLIGKTVKCLYDNGSATETVGMYSIAVINGNGLEHAFMFNIAHQLPINFSYLMECMKYHVYFCPIETAICGNITGNMSYPALKGIFS